MPNRIICSDVDDQVSDFGLTKFRADLKNQATKEIQGSLHWTGLFTSLPPRKIGAKQLT